jgi:preprotein translocase subunit SecG
LETYLSIAEIVVGIALVAIIILQTRGGGLGGMFGGPDTAIYKTRRGLERTLFYATIGLATLFLVVTMINVVAANQAAP